MQVINFSIFSSIRLLIFVTADSLSMVQRADCHMFPLLCEIFLGNDIQLFFFNPIETLCCGVKTHIREEPLFITFLPFVYFGLERGGQKFVCGTD